MVSWDMVCSLLYLAQTYSYVSHSSSQRQSSKTVILFLKSKLMLNQLSLSYGRRQTRKGHWSARWKNFWTGSSNINSLCLSETLNSMSRLNVCAELPSEKQVTLTERPTDQTWSRNLKTTQIWKNFKHLNQGKINSIWEVIIGSAYTALSSHHHQPLPHLQYSTYLFC